MNIQAIYQKLGELLWSIMNENAHIIFVRDIFIQMLRHTVLNG